MANNKKQAQGGKLVNNNTHKAISLINDSLKHIAMATDNNKRDTAQSKPLNAKAEKTVIINKTRKEVYAVYRNFEGLPKYINQLTNVRIINEKHSEWEAHVSPIGSYKFNMEIVKFEEDKFFSWQASTAKGLGASGTFTFKDAGGNATEVHAEISYHLPLGMLTKIFSPIIERKVDEEVKNFVSLVEKG